MQKADVVMAEIAVIGAAGIQLRSGSSVTDATILAETEDGFNNPPLGSLYSGVSGSTVVLFLRKAKAGASTDWKEVTVA